MRLQSRTSASSAVLVGAGLLAACTGSSSDAGDSGSPESAAVAEFEVVVAEVPDTALVEETVPDTAVSSTVVPDVSPTNPPGGTGESITVLGPFRDDVTVDALEAAFGEYGDAVGVDITYVGTFDYVDELAAGVAAGNPPDVVISPQPSLLAAYVDSGDAFVLPDEVAEASRESWPEDVNDAFVSDGAQFAVPHSFDMKSLVWFVPDVFDEFGFEVPTTFGEFEALIDSAVAAEIAPLCVGIESSSATGWVVTDWIEDIVLREHGPLVYDQWVAHEFPFDDERIVSSMQTVLDLWAPPNVYDGDGPISSVSFDEALDPLIDQQCAMHRQADFMSFYVDGLGISDGTPGSLDVFFFPSDIGAPALIAATGATAFSDRPEVWALLDHIASAEFADARSAAIDNSVAGSDLFSLAAGQDLSLYSAFGQRVVELALGADSYRLDGSDQMPPEVGAGSFWSESTRAVDGVVTAGEAAAAIESSWPS